MFGENKEASASDKAESAEKALQSNMCKGKVNATGLKQLTDFVSDPTAFFCNANWRMARAVERQYAAYGDSEKAAKAKQAREKNRKWHLRTGCKQGLASFTFTD